MKNEPNYFNSLYIHVPFCEKICFFCDFFKIKKSIKEMEIEYTKSLIKQIKINSSNWNLKTIYIGGGTPSSLDYDLWIKIFVALKPFIKQVEEFTIEVNPESVTSELIKLFIANKVNRISIGCQSFKNDLLKKANRKHTKEDIIEKYNLIKKMGIKNISIDLIYNLFDQTEDDIKYDLAMIKELKPNHLSWYSLILKENTFWGKKYKNVPDNDYKFDMFINSELSKMNYLRYEISSYALKPKYKSIHNLSYWTNKPYDAIGPSGVGFCNFHSDKSYLVTNTRDYRNWKYEKEFFSLEDYYFKILMMGLRLKEGIDTTKVKDAKQAINFYWNKIEIQVNKKMLSFKNNILKCSTKGFNFLDSILLDIIG